MSNLRIESLSQVDIIENPDFQALIRLYEEFKPWLEAYDGGNIPHHSAQEYAIMLFKHGYQARGEGNYGIAAMTIWRPGVQADQGGKITIRPAIPEKDIAEIAVYKPELAGKYVEMDVIGHNQLFRQIEPNGHAERQSMETAVDIWLHIPDEQIHEYMQQLEKQELLIFREAPDEKPGVGIVTTLEPCPGCSEMAITTGVDWVLSLNEDKSHGALHPERIADRLGPGWLKLAQQSGINILFAQETDQNDQLTYLPPNLALIVTKLFFETRGELDQKIGSGGTLMLIPGVKKEISSTPTPWSPAAWW